MPITSQSPTLPLDRTADESGGTNRWTDIWSPTIVSRIAGVCALVMLAILFPSIGPDYHSNMSAQRVVTYVSQNQKGIWIDGFISGMGNTLFALLLILLVALTLKSGLLARIAYVGAAGALAIGWVHAGVEFALADLAHRGGADAGILALFSLAKTMDYTDGVPIYLAVGCVSVLLLHSRALPRPVAWLGLAVAVVPFVVMVVQLAVAGTGNGPQGPVSVILGLLWLLVIGIALLVKPVRLSASPTGTEGTTV